MSKLQSLRDARDSYVVAWNQFIRSFVCEPTVYYCFFEGDDAKYFGTRIEMLNPSVRWTPLICMGKKGVLKIYDLIHENEKYRRAKVAFFVDRDFDSSHPDTLDCYVTPCYSIENLYVTETAFRRLLRQEFGLNEH